ncbi:family 16 glycosylhydrolase [Haloferax sp. YSMS24]|uniref:glycoside hydrolase family 16 protein n=1 Tax=Haloferax sp. YSMS24 TaxID=3388425 RepID=UPI00398D175F
MSDEHGPDAPDNTNEKSLQLGRRNLLKMSGVGALTALGATSIGVPASAAVSEGGPANQDNWTLTLEDTFESGTLNSDNWEIGFGWGRDTTGSPERIVDENVQIIDGQLHLIGTHDGDDIKSGSVNSRGRQYFGPGSYWEAKIKMPDRVGFLPAFWAKPNDESWPPEIDFVELFQKGDDYRDTHISNHFIHYSSSGVKGDSSTHEAVPARYDVGEDLSQDFHIYGCQWMEDRVVHFVDGVKVAETTDPTVMTSLNNGAPFYMMLNIHIDRVGETDRSESWGESMVVDWVRVWEHDGTSSSGSTSTTDDTTTSTDTEHYLWARSGDGNTVTFAFEASGGNIQIEPQDTTEDYWVSDDGTVAGGTTSKTSSLPGFRYNGEITDLRYDGDLDLFVDDSPVDETTLVDESEPGPYRAPAPDSSTDSTQTTSLPNTVTIDGSNYSQSASYSLSVTDALATTDSITSEDEISGTTATGSVGAGSDTYQFEGDVTDIALDGPADVYVNETRVDLVVVRRDPNSNGNVWYIIETDGELLKGETASASATSDDDVSSSKARGSVKDDADAYWLFNGDVLDVSTFGGDVVTTVNGQEI